jgi:hypothetical protein
VIFSSSRNTEKDFGQMAERGDDVLLDEDDAHHVTDWEASEWQWM